MVEKTPSVALSRSLPSTPLAEACLTREGNLGQDVAGKPVEVVDGVIEARARWSVGVGRGELPRVLVSVGTGGTGGRGGAQTTPGHGTPRSIKFFSSASRQVYFL